MTGKSICLNASECGAFNYCTVNDFNTCGGPVKKTVVSQQIYDNVMPEFVHGIGFVA